MGEPADNPDTAGIDRREREIYFYDGIARQCLVGLVQSVAAFDLGNGLILDRPEEPNAESLREVSGCSADERKREEGQVSTAENAPTHGFGSSVDEGRRHTSYRSRPRKRGKTRKEAVRPSGTPRGF